MGRRLRGSNCRLRYVAQRNTSDGKGVERRIVKTSWADRRGELVVVRIPITMASSPQAGPGVILLAWGEGIASLLEDCSAGEA